MNLSFIITVLLIVIITNSTLAILILSRSNRNAAHFSFAVWTFSISIWAYTNAHFQITHFNNTAYILSIISYLAGTLLASSLAYFSFVFPNDRLTHQGIGKYYKSIIIIPTIIIIILTIIPGGILVNVDIQNIPRKLETSLGLYFYAAHLFLNLGILFINLIKNYRYHTGIQKIQLGYIFIGLAASALFGLLFNIVLPLTNDYSYIWLGPDFTIILIIITAYAILRHRLFDIRIRLQNVLNALLPIILSLALTLFVGWVGYRLLFLNVRWLVIIIALTSILAYWGLQQLFARTSIGYILFRKTYKYRKALQNLADVAPTIVQLDVLSKQIVKTFIENMRVTKAAVLIRSNLRENDFDILEKKYFSQDELHPFLQVNDTLIESFTGEHSAYVCDEICTELETTQVFPTRKHQLRTICNICTQSQAAMIIGLRAQHTLVGFLLLGNKFPDKPYTSEDVALLEDISGEIAVALLNAKLHQDKEILTRMLREEVNRSTQALQDKVLENKELADVKSKFITVASHQMRTPISVVRNTMQMILEDYIDNTQNRKVDLQQEMQEIGMLLRNSLLASENLHNTIEMILAASEFAGGGVTVLTDKIETQAMLKQHEQYVRSLLRPDSKKNITLHVDIDEDLPPVLHQDKRKLRMIIDILLSNAVLYTLTGDITFRVAAHDNMLTIQVADTGIGIPGHEQHKLFERFIRLPNAQKVVPDGTGLGLYLAKEYTELLRGHLSFESEEGIGSTFTITIPVNYHY